MAALPDHFDLWIERAKREEDPAQRLETALGALFGLNEWHLLNQGTKEEPYPRLVEREGRIFLLVFSSPSQADDFTVETGERTEKEPLGLISIRTMDASEYVLRFRAADCKGLMVNPGAHGFYVTLDAVEKFRTEWLTRGGKSASGLRLTDSETEEEEFWQKHGL